MRHPAKIFISYSHQDQSYLDTLEAHLSVLRRQGIVEFWHDRQISAGQDWAGSIDENLKSADIILLLISSDFLASDYCYDIEVKQALAMHNAGEAVVIPLIIRPCDWSDAPFVHLQALPRNAKPISLFTNRDQAFVEVAQEVKRIAESVEPSEGLSPIDAIEIRLNVDFDSFTSEDETRFLETIKALLDRKHEIKVVNKRKGSVVLKLKLSRAEIARLNLATHSGELSDFSVIDAEIVSESESWNENTQRPRVFIGSSTEGVAIAETIQLNLDQYCEVTIWHQGVFAPGIGTLSSLLDASKTYDFAILVLTPDDLLSSRGDMKTSPRDNVLFELGLFMGSLGIERTMILYDRTADIKLPSDLAGITMITYQPHSSGNLEATLGAPCTRLKKEISSRGLRNS